MKPSRWLALVQAPQAGLVLVILSLGTAVSIGAGSVERNGQWVNRFLNTGNLVQMASDASFFAIMAVGITMVIITGGIDLSVGSIYALCGVATAIFIRSNPWLQAESAAFLPFVAALGICVGLGLICGLLNGLLVSKLKVHPFIITLGSMWAFRGVAFVISKGNSINYPLGMTNVFKSTIGLEKGQYPVPAILMALVTLAGGIYLAKTVGGRNIYAVGGNEAASRYSGLKIGRIHVLVFALSGMLAGLAAFAGCSFYGAASCADAQGYELFVIASAVVGGASLTGGKGTALGAMLGAVLIVVFRQSIQTLHFDQNYESIIIGCAVVVAVVLDQASSRITVRRMVRP